MKIIVMGPPGSGKTTQAELLAKKLNLPHLQTGQLYRKIGREDSLLGGRIRALLERGHLVPDNEHNQIIKKEIVKPKYKKGFVLDGSPRTLNQAKAQPFCPDKVFYLAVADKENIKRLIKRARIDDTPQLIAERLRIYHQETEPILAFFRKNGVLEEVDGERPIKIIFEDILARLSKKRDHDSA